VTLGWIDEVRSALAERAAERIPEADCGMRAAVTLILRDGEGEDPGVEALFVRRARVEGDPWSGHVALPGGRADPEDADLLDTARRETLEETGLVLERRHCLGRLAEIHPRSPHLPPICVTPFVAWLPGRQEVTLNHELTGHAWIPVSALADPRYRSTLVRETPSPREFPTIDYEGNVIWGLTFAILEDFLDLAGTGRPESPP
jgi:8-oxo-dGTP pyrophosphatase MutT (NUDIX family)